jgi:hypothetical protein
VDGPCNSLHVPRIVTCSFDSLVGRSRIPIVASDTSKKPRTREDGKSRYVIITRTCYEIRAMRKRVDRLKDHYNNPKR